MSAQENDSITTQGGMGVDAGFDDEFIPDDARPVCLRCLEPCDPRQYYCDKCGSYDVINPLTPYIAFVNIPFNYSIFLTMWRKIWYDKDTAAVSRVCYLLMITMFVPIFLVIGLPLVPIYVIRSSRLRKVALAVLLVVAIVVLVLFYYLQLRGIRTMCGPLTRGCFI